MILILNNINSVKRSRKAVVMIFSSSAASGCVAAVVFVGGGGVGVEDGEVVLHAWLPLRGLGEHGGVAVVVGASAMETSFPSAGGVSRGGEAPTSRSGLRPRFARGRGWGWAGS